MAVSCCGYFKGAAYQLKEGSQHVHSPHGPLGHFQASPWLYQSSGWCSSQTDPQDGADRVQGGAEPTCCDPLIY